MERLHLNRNLPKEQVYETLSDMFDSLGYAATDTSYVLVGSVTEDTIIGFIRNEEGGIYMINHDMVVELMREVTTENPSILYARKRYGQAVEEFDGRNPYDQQDGIDMPSGGLYYYASPGLTAVEGLPPFLSSLMSERLIKPVTRLDGVLSGRQGPKTRMEEIISGLNDGRVSSRLDYFSRIFVGAAPGAIDGERAVEVKTPDFNRTVTSGLGLSGKASDQIITAVRFDESLTGEAMQSIGQGLNAMRGGNKVPYMVDIDIDANLPLSFISEDGMRCFTLMFSYYPESGGVFVRAGEFGSTNPFTDIYEKTPAGEVRGPGEYRFPVPVRLIKPSEMAQLILTGGSSVQEEIAGAMGALATLVTHPEPRTRLEGILLGERPEPRTRLEAALTDPGLEPVRSREQFLMAFRNAKR